MSLTRRYAKTHDLIPNGRLFFNQMFVLGLEPPDFLGENIVLLCRLVQFPSEFGFFGSIDRLVGPVSASGHIPSGGRDRTRPVLPSARDPVGLLPCCPC